MDIALLRSTFEAVRPRADEVARAFYGRLLGTFPQVRPLFANTDFDAQRKSLVQSLATVVSLVDRPDELGPVLTQLGESHNSYGVEPGMYAYVSYSLLATLAETFGDDWTEEAAVTWEAALDHVSSAMIEAQGLSAA